MIKSWFCEHHVFIADCDTLGTVSRLAGKKAAEIIHFCPLVRLVIVRNICPNINRAVIIVDRFLPVIRGILGDGENAGGAVPDISQCPVKENELLGAGNTGRQGNNKNNRRTAAR